MLTLSSKNDDVSNSCAAPEIEEPVDFNVNVAADPTIFSPILKSPVIIPTLSTLFGASHSLTLALDKDSDPVTISLNS